MKACRILLADDHDIVLAGLRLLLDRPEFEVVGSVANGRELVNAAAELSPDLIIADLTMPVLTGIEAAQHIRKSDAGMKFVFLTMHSDIGYAKEALSLGLCGYVLKSSVADELSPAIREVLRGNTYVARAIREPVLEAFRASLNRKGTESARISGRQSEVLQLIVNGLTAKEIANTLGVSKRTVEFHKYEIMQKVGVKTIPELVRYAVTRGLAT